MITKDNKVMCDSCQKEIVGAKTTIYTNRNGWGVTRVKDNHFHVSPRECADATEPIKILAHSGVHASERKHKSG